MAVFAGELLGIAVNYLHVAIVRALVGKVLIAFLAVVLADAPVQILVVTQTEFFVEHSSTERAEKLRLFALVGIVVVLLQFGLRSELFITLQTLVKFGCRVRVFGFHVSDQFFVEFERLKANHAIVSFDDRKLALLRRGILFVSESMQPCCHEEGEFLRTQVARIQLQVEVDMFSFKVLRQSVVLAHVFVAHPTNLRNKSNLTATALDHICNGSHSNRLASATFMVLQLMKKLELVRTLRTTVSCANP